MGKKCFVSQLVTIHSGSVNLKCSTFSHGGKNGLDKKFGCCPSYDGQKSVEKKVHLFMTYCEMQSNETLHSQS